MNKKVKSPSQNRAINTRNLILMTAFKSFLKHGYKSTSTISISKSCKVSIGIVYSYFENKDELFELWLNSLLERLDDYFYNQFKLLQYNVELDIVISNILDKTSELFFSSPILDEKDKYVEETLSSFFFKAEQIFIKCCYEAMINLHHQVETAHTILQLIISYNKSLQNCEFNVNWT